MALITRESGLPTGVRVLDRRRGPCPPSAAGGGVRPHEDVLRLEGMPPMFTFDDSEGNTVILLERAAPPVPR
ncbi:hypothetical protein [Serinicoccus sp. CNJ-927]|uniref:hypothetical protein n=1 Tax=Serinicoccus sp. CNJ-927 TaxID=1904970 RepID=UPI00117ACC42|nr:hypothetical protein [Serinicoccus sp. CNJ-927]